MLPFPRCQAPRRAPLRRRSPCMRPRDCPPRACSWRHRRAVSPRLPSRSRRSCPGWMRPCRRFPPSGSA
ncbi:MAG TPA: hypothetical protein ENN11_00715 [Methanomicrobia archaeon]|nr:hypothetical protein [Methanomicrobia archaeon]